MADTDYRVISQRRTYARLPDDSFGAVMTVTFRTAGGVTTSVDVPIADYTADKVRAAIVAHAAEVDAIQGS